MSIASRRLPNLIALAALCAAASACGRRPPPPAPPPVKVTIAQPLRQDVIDWDDYVGQFQAVDSVDVRPRVSGYLVSVGFRDGALVTKGQTLFVIDPRPYQAALDQARGQEGRAAAALANAKTEATRGVALLAAKAISQQAFDALQATQRQDAADLAAAQAAVRAAALNVEFTRVIAPMSGRVSDRRVAPGNLVTADTTVLTNIVTSDPIRFAFTGSEALYLKYQRENAEGSRLSSRGTANPVEIRLQDESEYRWRGHMDFVDNTLDTSSGTIRGRAVVANPDGFLTPGMFGHMRLLGSAPYAAVLIPDQAVTTDQTRQVVAVVDSNGVARLEPVTPGPLSSGLRVIKSGLAATDWVVIEGVQRVQAGQKVKVVRGRIAAIVTPPDTAAAGPPSSTALPASGAR